MENTREILVAIAPEPSDYPNPLPPLGFSGDVSVEPLTAAAQIEAALTQVNQQLTEFVASANFQGDLQTAFGAYTDVELGATIIEALSQGETPEMMVLSATSMNGADGAFDSVTGTVYLSDAIIHSEKLVDVITEEFGHYIDSQLNEIDSPGDEGELFMRLVNGEALTEADITGLRNQNDWGFIWVEGEPVAVQMAYDTIEDALNKGVITEQIEIRDRIGFRQDGQRELNDFYKFTIREESEFNLTLDDLNANANVQLLDNWGSVIFLSNNPGRRAENINANLDPGDYYVRVMAVGPAQTEYSLSLSAEPRTVDLGQNLGVLNSLSKPVVINDRIGFATGSVRNVEDFFSFSLDKDSDVSITLDQLRQNANIQLLDADRETILFQSMNPGRVEDNINGILKAGDYVVRVFPQGAARTDYRLELTANEAHRPEELPGARVGDLIGKEEPFVIVDSIGFGIGSQRNQRDFYTFNLSEDASFYAQMDQLNGGANLFLHEYNPSRPKQLGSLLERVTAPGNRPRTISNFLEVGDYALVVGAQGANRTGYRLELDAQTNQSDYPTLATAKDLGQLGVRPINETNNVGLLIGDRFRDQEDWFKFSLSAEKNVDLVVDNLRVSVANVEIYDSKGQRIHQSKRDGTNARTISDIFDPGDYYVRVFATGSGNTDYRLSLSAGETISPVDILNIGALGASYSKFDNVGQTESGVRNELDVYNFTLNESRGINVTLDQFNQNINLELYQGFFDPDSRRGRPIAVSEERGHTPENIAEVLESGNYHLRVVPVGNAETRYRLAINAMNNEDLPKITIADTQVKEGDRGQTNARFVVTLDNPSPERVTVNYATADGTATVRDRDYQRTTGRLVFQPGQTRQFINVPVFGDTKVEPDETFTVNLTRPQNAELGRRRAIGTILNDDFQGGNNNPRPEPPDNDIFPNAVNLGRLTEEIVRNDRIGYVVGGDRNTDDYYRFILNREGTVRIDLDDLFKDANLQLLGSDGELISQSNNPGKNPETITARRLEPGTYYVRVFPHLAARTEYRLSIDLV
ncbi:pre-peptidase C-terminal domain-containing protein [Limnospira fusiformis]|uniref:pre-peptidase C-terminal domain-containing protein n=1 Tax=Limnospira fusiformis TaxID=54297 RepID=UPI00144972C0|nr:peptidase-like protein [Limnospira fusiformis SAG 85.79]